MIPVTADDVHDTAERFIANRHHDRRTGINHFLTADQTFGRVHGDGTHCVLAKMLGNFQNKAVADVYGFKGVQNSRQVIIELHVDNGADNLADAAFRA